MTESPSSNRVLPWLILLFIGSGCAALIYEIVWFQFLSLIVGSSMISLGVLLATFMGGLCIGSLGLAHYVSDSLHPLRVYAWLELGIGACGLLILWGLPYVDVVYVIFGGSGISGMIVRALFGAVFLLPPTIMMGATLPAIARWVEATPRGVAWLGFFYGGNTAGAVLGCLFAGFYLLRIYDTAVATYVAVAINIIVAFAAFVLCNYVPYKRVKKTQAVGLTAMAPGSRWILAAIALSGLTALGAEVIWTRLLTLLLGGTVYTFSLILAAFLAGIGLGSVGGSMLAASVKNPRWAFGVCQILVAIALAWAAFVLTRSLPYWPMYPQLPTSPWITFQIDFLRCLITVLPAAMLWGASFPLALAALASKDQDSGSLVGIVYAANTAGAILGAIITPLIFITWIGTQATQQVLIGIAAIGASLLFLPVLTNRQRWVPAGAMALVVILMATSVAPLPAVVVGYGRNAAMRRFDNREFLMVGEGMNSSMAVSCVVDCTTFSYHNAGKVQASSLPKDMRLQRMLGHLTTLVPAKSESVLVIGCGAGVTAGAVSIDPLVTDLTIVEIEPLVPQFVAQWFGEYNFNVVTNRKTTVIIDDARHYLLTTDKKFDAITSDPFDPWVKGAAALYTEEFWQLARSRLNPGGVVTVFVQLYESNLAAVKSEIATFLEVFPEGMVFANLSEGEGYDVVLLGQADPGQIDLNAIDVRLRQPEFKPVRVSLAEVGFGSLAQLFGTFALRKPEIDPWIADAQINRDRNLRIQYLAGISSNFREQAAIYRDMARYRSFPEGIFIGSVQKLVELRKAFDKEGSSLD